MAAAPVCRVLVVTMDTCVAPEHGQEHWSRPRALLSSAVVIRGLESRGVMEERSDEWCHHIVSDDDADH